MTNTCTLPKGCTDCNYEHVHAVYYNEAVDIHLIMYLRQINTLVLLECFICIPPLHPPTFPKCPILHLCSSFSISRYQTVKCHTMQIGDKVKECNFSSPGLKINLFTVCPQMYRSGLLLLSVEIQELQLWPWRRTSQIVPLMFAQLPLAKI